MSPKPWSKSQLNHMLFHNFLGTLADNSIEIGWVLRNSSMPFRPPF